MTPIPCLRRLGEDDQLQSVAHVQDIPALVPRKLILRGSTSQELARRVQIQGFGIAYLSVT